jgi:ABC-type multidrug transport system ATPase subunit
VKDLSGGQKRRLQLMLTLLDEPNVLILDEPTNDLDTDMLAALEDLLDSWPGTLIVVSHDRYLIERVTDQQYAVIDAHLRHLPGGIEEYLSLIAHPRRTSPSAAPASRINHSKKPSPTADSTRPTSGTATDPAPQPAAGQITSTPINSAEERALRKQLSAIERKLERSADQISALHNQIAGHDPSDYETLASLAADLSQVEQDSAALEDQWLELSEQLG